MTESRPPRVQLEALPRLTTDSAERQAADAMNRKLIDLELRSSS